MYIFQATIFDVQGNEPPQIGVPDPIPDTDEDEDDLDEDDVDGQEVAEKPAKPQYVKNYFWGNQGDNPRPLQNRSGVSTWRTIR